MAQYPEDNRPVSTVLFHFAAGTLGALIVFLVFVRLSGARRFSAPFVVIFVGISCAVMANFLSPWATPVIVVSYFLVSLGEYMRERNAQRARKAEGSGSVS
jgi:hypothetical protein